ncbi:MAG: hypothetical protein HLUCCA11_21740 [Phormidesmis priestleyi Ana]|uniref:Uncharacterized protein n=1 Tax=Phormidesmis priestleyi Ana TaxID=1666911 RepID=A0A0P8D8B4_9CYAN|nr:MAG: hypothetical protein HLUCCA11_21740 [Phormidesmis priestleyi Ana]
MKRFTSFAFSVSAFSVLLTAGVIAPSAKALPQVASDFNLQTLRLSELDARNKSEDTNYPYSKPQVQTPAQTSSPANWSEGSPATNVEAADLIEGDSTTVAADAAEPESTASRSLSLTERRHQLLDRD